MAGSCSGPGDSTCAGTCVGLGTACTCPASAPPACPTPQTLPNTGEPFFCNAACTQVGARLYYRDEIVGSSQFTQYEIEILDPATGRVRVRRQTSSGSEDFETTLSFGGGSGGITTPPGANALFGGLGVYEQLFCGWPIGCAPDGTVLIPNGTTHSFQWTHAFGTTYRFALSCAGCGGGAAQVNATWQGARCALDAFARVQRLCRGYNPFIPAGQAPQCCGCASDPACPASAPTCVDGTCM